MAVAPSLQDEEHPKGRVVKLLTLKHGIMQQQPEAHRLLFGALS